MKTQLIVLFGIIILGTLGCQENKVQSSSTVTTTDTITLNNKIDYDSIMFKDAISRENERYEKIFEPILDTTWRQDSSQFLEELDNAYGLINSTQGQIVACYQQVLNGYTDTVYVLEYSIPLDSVCEHYPHQQQFIFNRAGQLLHQDQAAVMQFVEIWEEQAPLLMALNSSCEGLGKHHFYKYENGRLIDIFNVFLGDEKTPYTYLNLLDSVYFEPAELVLKTIDLNKDGYNDLSFKGKKVVVKDEKGRKYSAWRPYKKELIEYQFIYKPTKGLFFLQQKSE